MAERKLKNLCVYCGSRYGDNQVYREAARELGALLAAQDINLVYGGGAVGLMGEVASAVVENGGVVVGVIPRFLREREIEFKGADELIVTEDMHERKRLMFDRADAFLALPGGIGTLEELVEILTWSQLDRHDRPVMVANLDGFWQPLMGLLDHMVEEGFVEKSIIERILVFDTLEALSKRLLEGV